MRTPLLRVALAVGLGFGVPTVVSAQHWTAGRWIGGFESGAGTTYLSAHFADAADGLAGTIDLPLRGDIDVPLQRVRANDRSLSFETRAEGATLLFEGRRRDEGRVSGSVRQGFQIVRFEMMKVTTLTPERIDAVTGNYELEPGHVVLITRSQNGLIYVDQQAGRLGSLYALDDRTLVAGPTIGSGYPVELIITVPSATGQPADRVVWHARGREPVTGTRRTFYRTEQIGYHNGSLRLSATLVLPNTPGPHPAIVMVHGSGPATRDTLRHWADVYARAGVAVLISDKRGTGASMGSWSQATFADLAGDALAGLAFLQGRPEINPRQVGLHGMSLGSWVAPLAALRSRDVAFVIAESAPALTPAEHELMRVEHQLRADGFPRLTIARARAFMDQKFEVARTGEGWDALNAKMTRAAREGWLSYVNPPTSLESLRWHWTHVLSYDPLPALEQLACPILVLYGGLDSIVPASVHRDRMAAALRRAKTGDVTIKVFEKANHAFLEAVTGGRREGPALRGFVAGYLGTQVNWVVERVGLGVTVSDAAPELGPSESPGPERPNLSSPSAPAVRPELPSASRFFPPSAP